MRIRRPKTIGDQIRDVHRLKDEMFSDGRPSPWYREELEPQKVQSWTWWPWSRIRDELVGPVLVLLLIAAAILGLIVFLGSMK